MNTHGLQYALRELRRVFGAQQVIAAIFGISAILALSGPFGTSEDFSLPEALVYWAFVVVTTFAIGSFFGLLAKFHLMNAKIRETYLRLFVAPLAALPVVIWIAGLNWLVFSLNPFQDRETQWILLMVFFIGIIVGTLFQILDRGNQPSMAAIIDRLPTEKRGALVSLSVQDHYVEVVTTNGSDLLLMRLSDAIREASPSNGMRVHRSHWINLDYVLKANRQAERTLVVMRDGREIPVSRSYIKDLKAKGITPRTPT